MKATLADVLTPGRAVAGLVCLGWEDARAYAHAAQAEGLPVVLQAGPGARRHMPIRVWGPMLRTLADAVDVPVVVHLDHGEDAATCREAIEHGFTSVMFDGSRLPFDENATATRAIAEEAHRAGVSCEGEIGFVGYAEGAASAATDPREAAVFARETGVDALAVSVGNVHLMHDAAPIDEAALDAIAAATDVPLVIHGGSGVPAEQRRRLAGRVAKFNIGTELRRAFGRALRARMDEDDAFDRIALLSAVEPPLVAVARAVIRNLEPT